MSSRRNRGIEDAVGSALTGFITLVGVAGWLGFEAMNKNIKGPVTDRLRSQNPSSLNGQRIEIVECCDALYERVPGITHTCSKCNASLFALGEPAPNLDPVIEPPPKGMSYYMGCLWLLLFACALFTLYAYIL